MIYIFYLDYIPKTKKEQIHGGNVYSKRVMKLLSKNGIKYTIIIPFNYHAIDSEEKELFGSPDVHIMEVKNLHHGIKLEDNSILFFPLLKTRNMYLLKQYKTINKGLAIYITVHGLRFLDLKYDSYDQYYHSGLQYILYPLVQPVLRPFKCFVYKKVIKKYLNFADKIFTVSNYSLVQIVSNLSPNYIKYFYCGTNLSEGISEHQNQDRNYILFVNAGRTEKNFLRTLEAFIDFKRNDKKDYFLYVTGLSNKTISLLKRSPLWNEQLINKWVVFLDFLDLHELTSVYCNCKFVVYTSKSEGFGLPAIEACLSGVPIIVSYGSSIPEVLESAAYYVNPYQTKSIRNAIHFMTNHKNYAEYKKKVLDYRKIVKERIEISDKNFVAEFRNEI